MREKDCVLCPFRSLFDRETDDAQKKLIQVRRQVRFLYFQAGWSKRRIVRELGGSKHFVIRWTRSMEQDPGSDHRGWPGGRRRRWSTQTERRIKQLHAVLQNDPEEFFSGATAVQHRWRLTYPAEKPPSLRTIGRIMKALGLTVQNKKVRRKGAARYLCYPEKTVYGGWLGERVMEVDFIERRYLKGRGQPLQFIGFSAKSAPRLRYFQRLEDLTARTVKAACEQFFERFETPQVLKLDNAPVFVGSGSGQRTVSRLVIWLLQHKIYPVFSVPKRPFTQASIEGNNSVFSRFFWNRRTFQSVADVDCQLNWFNQSSLRYTEYQRPNTSQAQQDFLPQIYFLRQVQESEHRPGSGSISVANEEVSLPATYINFFVLAQWNLKSEQLSVFIEQNETLHTLTEIDFPINPQTKKRLKKGGARLFDL
jgi:transposase